MNAGRLSRRGSFVGGHDDGTVANMSRKASYYPNPSIRVIAAKPAAGLIEITKI
jgi:hypothetical protein